MEDSENTQELVDLPTGEDDGLDDFFAKKDKGRKGKKKKSKFITTDALAKTLEKISTGVEEEEETKKEKEQSKTTDGNKGQNNNDVEEWHEYEDESQRDYSDLKIQNFQISEQKEAEEPYVPQYNEEGELILPKEAEGPWRSVGKDPQSNAPSESAPVRKPEPAPEQPPTTKAVYRPPHARMSQATAGGSSIPPGMGRRRRPQEAPVINSEIDFPSLASAVQDTEQHVGFETVKSGAKSISRSQQQQQNVKAAGLTLGNQFEALRD